MGRKADETEYTMLNKIQNIHLIGDFPNFICKREQKGMKTTGEKLPYSLKAKNKQEDRINRSVHFTYKICKYIFR